MRCRRRSFHEVSRTRTHAFTARSGMLLRSEMPASERDIAGSRRSRDIHIWLGEHPIVRDLAALDLGPAIGFTYASSYEIILTPVIESFVV